MVDATITYTTMENGEEVTKEETFSGTEEEVEAKLKEFEASISVSEDKAVKVIKEMEVIKQ